MGRTSTDDRGYKDRRQRIARENRKKHFGRAPESQVDFDPYSTASAGAFKFGRGGASALDDLKGLDFSSVGIIQTPFP